MEDEFYMMRFVAHRPTFAQDLNDEEREMMRRHVEYWTREVHEGTVLMFGPVIDPRESWGFGVLRVASEVAALALTQADPAKALGRHEILRIPMLVR